MKKMNIFKVLMTVAFAMIIFGANAQWVDSTATGNSIDSVTVGTTVPFYVEPDQYLSPGTTAVTDTASVTSTFGWVIQGTLTGAAVTWQSNNDAGAANDADGNYVEINFPTANVTGQLYVTETAASGGCAGTQVTLDVEVVTAPTVAFTAGGGFIDANIQQCEGVAALDDDVQVTFTDDIAGSPAVNFEYTYVIDTISATSVTAQYDSTIYSGNGGGPAYDNPAVQAIDAATYNLGTASFTCVANPSGIDVTTVYIYTILGVNDRISRKSDYLTNPTADDDLWTVYDAGGSVAITVYPAPVTGPIYHINNLWNN